MPTGDTFKLKDEVWKIHTENIPGERKLWNLITETQNARKKYMRQRWVFYTGKIKKKEVETTVKESIY